MKTQVVDFRTESLDQLKKLHPDDVVLFDHTDIPINYILVAHPNKQIVKAFKKLYKQLQNIEHNHYYYPYSDLHLTLIGNIPMTTNLENLIETVSSEIAKGNLFFKLWGIGSNKYCSSVSAYPVDFSLHKFRENIRKKIHAHGDDYSSILKSYEYVGWINYLRYLHKPSQELLDTLYDYKDTIFGVMEPSSIRLYQNKSKVLDASRAKLLHTFT